MTKISYFQRFSQKENHATNNTLLLLRHFYQASPQKINAMLSDLSNDDISVGLVFEQQVRSSDSVPDALITQAPLDIYIETKRGGQLDQNQIERHIASIGNRSSSNSKKILISLTRTPIAKNIRDDISGKAQRVDIAFLPITFEDVVRSLRAVCERHEVALQEILSDYEHYLEDEDLLQVGEIMSVFPCGHSIRENIRYRLYFEPPDRPSKAESTFIGLYTQMCVGHLASIKTVVTGVVGPDGFMLDNIEKGELSDEDKKRISEAVEACIYYPQLAQEPHRYYLLDEIYKTNFIKSTPYGMMNRRVFNLSRWLNYDDKKQYTPEEVAIELQDRNWE